MSSIFCPELAADDALSSGMSQLGLEGRVAPRVIDEFDEAIAIELSSAFAGVVAIALDAEGVDLSRHGRISIVQVSTPTQCFLIDVLDKDADDPLVAWLRTLLENEEVVKIIHDCRMDADALHHLLSIALINVHDTSCWHAVLTGQADKNLNDTLSFNGIENNTFRDGSVYRTNPAFWATRPLTRHMVDWASGDVQFMFSLYHKQLSANSSSDFARVKLQQESFLSWKTADVGFVPVRNIGKFIGRGGTNIRLLQRTTSTLIYDAPAGMPGYRKEMFMVYYSSAAALQRVKQAACR
jgi:hypothetical protein